MILAGVFGVAPVSSAAEEVCECWCETKGGATRHPDSTTELTREQCQTQCPQTYKGYAMAVCATSSGQLPSQSVNCFTPAQCKKQNGDFDDKFQPPECMSGSHYCYPDSSKAAKVTLSTSIGGLTVTGDLGEYIARLYAWMVGSATTIAIVLIMVAGIRWSLGGLSADAVGKAKKTISNAVAGLVLLLGSYLILFTINPQLLKLQVPKFPMIRQVGLVDSNTSCGYLTGESGYGTGYPDSPHNYGKPPPKGGKKYTVENNGTKCGTVSKVTKDWEGKDLPDGSTCTWDTCPINKDTPCADGSVGKGGECECFVNAAGGQCLACGDVVVNNLFIEPSSSVCAQLSLPEKTGIVTRTIVERVDFWSPDETQTQRNVSVPIINQCFWTKNGSMIDGVQGVLDILTGTGTCAMLQLDCSKIKSCEAYDTIPRVVNKQKDQQLEAIQLHGAQTGIAQYGGSYGDLSLSSICNADPCLVGVEGKTRCRSDQPQPQITGSFSDFVSIDGNDCETVNISN